MLLILYGRSGSGKSTQERLIEECLDFKRLISYTSRKPRSGEVDGVDYHFVTEDEIKSLYEEGKLVELNYYNGNYYGAPLVTVDDGDVVAVLELKGIHQMYKACMSLQMPPEIKVIKLECSKETALQRCKSRPERVEHDEEVFSGKNIGHMPFVIVDADRSVNEVFSSIRTFINFNRVSLNVIPLGKFIGFDPTLNKLKDKYISTKANMVDYTSDSDNVEDVPNDRDEEKLFFLNALIGNDLNNKDGFNKKVMIISVKYDTVGFVIFREDKYGKQTAYITNIFVELDHQRKGYISYALRSLHLEYQYLITDGSVPKSVARKLEHIGFVQHETDPNSYKWQD